VFQPKVSSNIGFDRTTFRQYYILLNDILVEINLIVYNIVRKVILQEIVTNNSGCLG
jgi:hypothetical protein